MSKRPIKLDLELFQGKLSSIKSEIEYLIDEYGEDATIEIDLHINEERGYGGEPAHYAKADVSLRRPAKNST